jgi:predicted Zn-dependent peptidase
MPHVRSVSIGVWLARGSRHETEEQSGIAHFVEHMLFKGTGTRTAEDIAQTVDSIGGQMDAFTAKEYASYYFKVLDEHLPLAVEVLADIVMNPAFSADDIGREKKVVLEEIKMVEDTPDDLVHELFTENLWPGHPLGRPILGTKETVEALTQDGLRQYFGETYSAPNLIVAAVGNIEHERVRDLVQRAFDKLHSNSNPLTEAPPNVVPTTVIRNKELEQSHVCLGTGSYRQDHDERYSSYVLNTGARRVDELAAVSERSREAGTGLRGVQRAERLSRCRFDHDLRGLCQRRRRRIDRCRDWRTPAVEG